MNFENIIRKKRDGRILDTDEITYLVKGICDKSLPDYQLSAWAMAVYFQGMNDQETRDLSLAMAYSGETADLSSIPGIKVDKHSTGGVGDKTTLIVIPLVAACGVPVAKMSGRGLGHTGGTVDKYSSIPGFRVEMDHHSFIRQVREVGAAVISQSGNLVPADKKLYAIRDLTATVESIPLIASSIMSKKIASGADAIVLDVKVGKGAFMKDLASARQLARTMVEIGKGVNRKVVAVLSSMEEPLGRMIGNSLEVQEAIACLAGKGPQDLMEISVTLAAYMLVLGNKHSDLSAARRQIEEILASGRGLEKFMQIIKAQGGNLDYSRPGYGLPQPGMQRVLKADRDGYVTGIDAYRAGRAAMMLGAGREYLEDIIDYTAGIELIRKQGEAVQTGDTLAILYYNDNDRADQAYAELAEAYTVGSQKVAGNPIIIEVID